MFFRIIKSFLFIIISVAILGGGFFAGIYSRDYYKIWRDRLALRDIVNTYEQAQKEAEARKMADTYGGKTPQETLQMFIDAVEQGDYELASRYFVEGKREEWRKNLQNTNSVDFLLEILKDIDGGSGKYDESKESYIIHDPILVDFVLYPNGIWKLTEI